MPTRVRTPSASTGGGGGGSGLESWKGHGGDDGSYKGSQDKLRTLRGAFNGVLDKFSKEVGDPFKKQLISSEVAGKAVSFAETQAPKYVQNAKDFYASAKTASDSDLAIKKEQTKWAMAHSVNLVNQQEQDHLLARQQMQNVVASATMQWETTEQYLKALGSLEQLAIQTNSL